MNFFLNFFLSIYTISNIQLHAVSAYSRGTGGNTRVTHPSVKTLRSAHLNILVLDTWQGGSTWNGQWNRLPLRRAVTVAREVVSEPTNFFYLLLLNLTLYPAYSKRDTT